MYHRKSYEKIRQEVLERDHHKCQLCGSSKNVEVHHKDGKGAEYDTDDMNNDKGNLITLCHRCHLTLEAMKRERAMKPKIRKEKIRQMEKQSWILYRQGLTTREVGRIVNRSHAWVALVVKKFEKARSGLNT